MLQQHEINTAIKAIITTFLVEAITPIVQDATTKAITEYFDSKKHKELLTVNEAAEYLSVSRQKIFGMLRSGKLDRKKVQGCRNTYVSYEQLSANIKTIHTYSTK